MKAIKFTLKYEFKFTTDYHKIIACIVKLLDEEEKINKTSIKKVLIDNINITGFYDDITFATACSFVGVNNFEYSDLQDKINITVDAIEIYNKLYCKSVCLEDLDLESQ